MESRMKKRRLGQGLLVSEMGLGCMGMSEFHGTADETRYLNMSMVHH